MKKTLLSLMLLLAVIMTSGKNVPADQAARTAKNFYFVQHNQIGQTDDTSLTVTDIYPITHSGQIVYYHINMSDNGWVIVSAEDAVTPVLAYGFNGAHNQDQIPPQYAAWMEGYAHQITWARNEAMVATPEVSAAWERLNTTDPTTLQVVPDSRDVTPMLTSTWNQGNPYNFMCPADPAGSGGHVYAGCVATAMAQVLYYYRWPETGTGMHCYTPSGYTQQCADFENTTYLWNEMVNSTGQRDTAMGLIQWHCGIAVDMMYGAGGSGAYSGDAAAALRDYFKYHPNTELVYKEDYTEEDWAALLRENLDAKRPMYYHGFGSGGHAFNVDGYQGTDYFHFNWGWGGSNNGYYYLNNLNPGGSNFTEGQGAIVNIYPDTLSYTYPVYCAGDQTLTALKGTFEDGSCAQNYQNNADCSWLIAPESDSDSIIGITISFQRFATEAGTDIVTIYQGDSEQGDVVGTFSGNTLPDAIMVDGNRALVTFTSNSSTTAPGWFASYQSTSMEWCAGMTALTDPSGIISDGSFDYNYKNSTMCRWNITPEGAGALELSFTSFRTDSENDVLRIYDVGSEELIASISGIYTGTNLPSPVTAPSGKMFLIFSTDAVGTEAGWEAQYFTYPVGVENNQSKPVVAIFPNPASDYLIIQIKGVSDEEITVKIADITGQMILQERWFHASGDHRIDLSSMASGIYLLRIETASWSEIKKVVVE